MNYPTSLLIGGTTLVWLPQASSSSDPGPDSWYVNVDGIYYGPTAPVPPGTGGYNVSFVQESGDGIVVDIYVIPTITVGHGITAIFFHTPPPYIHSYEYEASFTANCIAVAVNITKETPESRPVPSTSPQQYLHRYSVSAQPIGGTGPFTYVWSKSISGTGVISSDFVPSTPTGDSCTLEVTTTTQNFGGIAGSVTCTVTDSNSCTDTASADVADAPDPTSHCSSPSPDAGSGGDSCSCQRPPDTSGQPCPDGNLRTGPGDPNGYLNWPFGGGGGLTGGGSRGNPSPSRPTNPDPMFVL